MWSSRVSCRPSGGCTARAGSERESGPRCREERRGRRCDERIGAADDALVASAVLTPVERGHAGAHRGSPGQAPCACRSLLGLDRFDQLPAPTPAGLDRALVDRGVPRSHASRLSCWLFTAWHEVQIDWRLSRSNARSKSSWSGIMWSTCVAAVVRPLPLHGRQSGSRRNCERRMLFHLAELRMPAARARAGSRARCRS